MTQKDQIVLDPYPALLLDVQDLSYAKARPLVQHLMIRCDPLGCDSEVELEDDPLVGANGHGMSLVPKQEHSRRIVSKSVDEARALFCRLVLIVRDSTQKDPLGNGSHSIGPVKMVTQGEGEVQMVEKGKVYCTVEKSDGSRNLPGEYLAEL